MAKKDKSLEPKTPAPVTEIPVTPDVNYTESISLPNVEDTQREMILDLRAKGFDDNRIAARLEIRKDIVENIR